MSAGKQGAAATRQPVARRINGVLCRTGLDAINAWHPEKKRAAFWRQHAEFIRAAAAKVASDSPLSGQNQVLALEAFVRWAVESHVSLDPEVLFHPDTVERYALHGMRHLSQTSRTTRRSVIGKIAAANTRRAPWSPPPKKMGRHATPVPYTERDVELLLRAGREQPFPRRQRSVLGMIYLCAGAGVSPSDVVRVRGVDVVEDDGYVRVRVGGKHPRIVTVRDQFAAPLLELARDAGDTWLLGANVDPDGKSPLEVHLHGIRKPHWMPKLSSHRLRYTWMVAVLDDGIPFADFMDAAGLTTASQLGELLPLLIRHDANATNALMAGRHG